MTRTFRLSVAVALSATLIAGCGSTTSSTSTPNVASPVSQFTTRQAKLFCQQGLQAKGADLTACVHIYDRGYSEGTYNAATYCNKYFKTYNGNGGCEMAYEAGYTDNVSHVTSQTDTAGSTQPTVTSSSTTPDTVRTRAAPDPNSPPAFSLRGQTENGDKLRIEGHFGPILPANESDVDQTVLAECPRYDGRELVTRLDLATTIESSLPGTVLVGGLVPPLSEVTHLVDYVFDYTEGPSCDLGTDESEITINMGTLQPHQPHNFTMWVVLLDAITPSDPHPSLQTLAHQNWLMGAPEASVDGASVRLSGDDAGIPLVK
jgi:hypothetical protein